MAGVFHQRRVFMSQKIHQPTGAGRGGTSRPILLASTSPFRQSLLRAAGIAFLAEAPGVEEHAPPGLSPKRLARHLARLKAEAVAARHPGDLVVGSDQTAELEGGLLRKPHSRAEARRQLAAMAGRAHWLHTAVALRRREPALRRVGLESVKLTMRRLTRREIEAYLDTGEWEGCAGSYRIEGRGILLLEAVRGDYHAVVGLPLLRLTRMLREAGVRLLG